MKAERGFPRFIITPKGTRWVEQGHPWIYADEVIREEGACENGALADAVSEKGKYLGTGFVSRESKIRLRLLSRNANDRFDEAFWKRRIKYAWDYRKTVMGEDISCCRVIFGEADSFPGLTVDRFSDILVTQTLSVGMEKIKPMLFPLLVQVLREDGQEIRGIYERNDVAIRALEGMEQNKGWFPLAGETPPDSTITEICENGIVYSVDVENGQKTGFFLDQKYNRLAMQRICTGKTVLDCFTHMGTFALNAGLAGAQSVLGLDISEFALAQAEENARRNCLQDRVRFRCANVLEELPRMAAAGEQYDVVILDPPAFTKSREATKNAIRGYREVNINGLKLVKNGGYLASCSCSHFMTQELLAQTIREAARIAHKRLRQVEFRTQAMDHPILWAAEESYYLKFFIFQCVEDV